MSATAVWVLRDAAHQRQVKGVLCMLLLYAWTRRAKKRAKR